MATSCPCRSRPRLRPHAYAPHKLGSADRLAGVGAHRVDDRAQLAAAIGEPVLDFRWTGGDHPALDQSGRLEVAQALREHPGRDAGDRAGELVEAQRSRERRWQLSIICAALAGALRFNEFADAVAGISPRMLSERLRDLEAAGLIERKVIPSSPPKVEYRLTSRGRQLGPVIDAIRAYANEPVG